jgi:hypothetical protein
VYRSVGNPDSFAYTYVDEYTYSHSNTYEHADAYQHTHAHTYSDTVSWRFNCRTSLGSLVCA